MPDDKKSVIEKAPTDAVTALNALVKELAPQGAVLPNAAQQPPADSHSFFDMLHRDAMRAAGEIKRSVKEQRDAYIRKMHDKGGVDGRFTFESIRIDQFNQRAVNEAKAFCASAPQMAAEPVVLIIQGFEGTGKTVLCNAIANYFLRFSRNPSVELVSFEALRQQHFYSNTEDKEERQQRARMIEHYESVNLLILDPLTSTREGFSLFDQKIFANLLRNRLQRRLSMVMTIIQPFGQLHNSIGDLCFESLKAYSVLTTELYGQSRRPQIMVNGVPLR